MSAKKLWRTEQAGEVTSHPTRPSAYRWIHALAERLAEGETFESATVTVWVDERLGRGWELYERVDLREHAAAQTGMRSGS